MKKNLVLIITIVVVAIGGLVFVLAGDDSKSSSDSKKSSGSNSEAYGVVKACDVFTEAEAKKVMGDSASAGSNTPDVKSDDVNVSTCSYTNNATSVADIKIATVMVRSALSKEGADSNKAGVLASGKSQDAQTVKEVGDEAYFAPATGQLNILDDNNWIIVSYGGTSPSSLSLDNAEEVAHNVLNHSGVDHDQMPKN